MAEYNKIIKLSPTISSKNLGDYIIDDYCNSIIEELFANALIISVPTHERLSRLACEHIASANASIVCGTNLLSSHLLKYRQWNIGIYDGLRLFFSDVPKKKMLDKSFLMEHFQKNKVLLLGAGWWQYQDKPDYYTAIALKLFLSSEGIHSVRDSYTEKMLKEIGITNVVNTACPSMWNLSQEHCSKIPRLPSDTVVTTLTNYNTNYDYDEMLLDILTRNYKNVFVWLQAIEDYDLITRSKHYGKLNLIPPTLKSYDAFLDEVPSDYIGTRLHGGIRALNKKHRTIIVAVDNRALEISKDTGLNIIRREEIENRLENMIHSELATGINLPTENINIWKGQFH